MNRGRRSPPEGSGETPSDLVVPVLLAALTVAAYWRVFACGFVSYDDPAYVTENARVLAGLGWSGLVWAFTTTAEANWHPVTWLSLMLDASIGGADPRVYHATNLALHVANTLLLFALLRSATGERWRSAFVAALFAVHPLHVESVAWVSERKDVLSTLFWLLATAAWARHVASPSTGRLATVLLAFALGLLTKPMLVTLPLTLLLLDYWPLGRWKETAGARGAVPLIVEKAPLLAMAALSAAVTLLVQRPAMQVLQEVPFGARVANALVSLVVYAGKMLWPQDLAVIYPHPRTALPLWQPAGAALILAGVSLAAIRWRRGRPWLPVGWLFYVVTLIPVLGLVQVGFHARADRYTYVPLVGLFVVVAWGVPELVARMAGRTASPAAARTRARRRAKASDEPSGRIRVLPALATAAVLFLAARTWEQVGHWRSSVTLFGHAVAVTSENGRAHYNLSTAYQESGDVDRAIQHLREAVRIDSGHQEAHFNLTRLLMKQGKLDEAAALVRDEQARWPSHPHTFVDLGVLAALQGDTDEAVRWFTEALRLSPDLPDARHNLEALQAERNRKTGGAPPAK